MSNSEALDNLINEDTRIKVSSTLDKSVSKKCLIDGSPETCWTSQQGTPQYIQVSFPSPVLPKRIELTFQGGFVGTRCSVEVLSTSKTDGGETPTWRVFTQIYPEDVNRKQSFDLITEGTELMGLRVESIKLVFEESSDFFGRITVYDLQVLGVTMS
ncbi:galactose-binding domain-like protein [Trametes maxima]|nr:galactose-binding domain-like protein [Trametes maxima]